MKKIPIRILKKRLELLLWLWIIVLFLMTYHGKVEEAKAVQGVEPDIYEEDDQPEQAWPIVVNNPDQLHTFHTDTDIDWVYFFGHVADPYSGKPYKYDISAVGCDRAVTISLADANGEILTIEAGIPIQSTSGYFREWQSPKDGYYCLKIEPPSEYPPEGISYKLSIKKGHAAIGTTIHGRVVNLKKEGINGLRVFILDSGQEIGKGWTVGSIREVRDNNLDPSKVDGWYFITLPEIISGVYDFRVTEDDPNVILKQNPIYIDLSPRTSSRIEDIVLDYPNGEADVVSDFDYVYSQYQNFKRRDYPVWEDKDKDGASNMEEFLAGTDLDKPDNFPNNTWDMSLPIGWSMISITLIPECLSVSQLFPDSEAIYAHDKGLGYRRVKETEKLEVGRGYWILLNEGKNYTLTGKPIYSYTLSVNEEGWEMIGGCTYAAKPLVDGCHISVIYRYDNESGYERVNDSEDLEPGKGYWILLNDIVNQCELTVEGN